MKTVLEVRLKATAELEAKTTVDAKGCYIRVEGYRQVKNQFLR